MKVRIREGNDFDVVWAIKRAGQPEDLSSAINMKLTLVVYGLVIEHSLFTVADNMLSINIPKEVATINGDYRLIFEYTLPDAGQPDGDLKCKTDVVPFRIVPFTADADDVYTVNTSSDVLFGFKGDKGDGGDDAYQIWLDLGNEGTYEDFIAYMRQPAVDAGASISELEGEIQASEGLRVSAESERDLAEGTRLQSESERSAAEIIRQSNEGDRIENEDTRVQNEAERISKEGIRQSNETNRVEAEGIRQSNETNRVEAEGLRVNAETGRNTAEGLRASAETGRNTAEGTRVTQENTRQTNTATAISGANEAAQSANTAAGLANTARENIQADLALKASHGYESNPKTLKEVDDEVIQLAGEVSLLDAVHSDKIKDIENVLSTANLGQSAQLSVSSVSPLSLPKNASNGGMQVKLEGFTAENLVVNGDFRNGTTGWIAASPNAVNIRIDGGMIVYDSTGSWNGIMTPISIQTASGDKCYIRTSVMANQDVGNSLSSVGFYEPNIVSYGYGELVANTLKPISAIITSSFTGLNSIRIRTGALSGAVVKWGKTSLINLTQIFGAGNEPDLATCDAMFSDYFEGKKNFIPTGRVRSVDKNGLNPTALYLTAPELRSNGLVKDEIRKGANGYELVKRISDIDGTVLATPVIYPISYGGILNSAENGTVYHEPVIADAGVYGMDIPIFNTDYPIASIEEIIKHEGGVDTYLNASTAVIAPDGLSFTHPDLASGDLVLFTYSFDKESTNGNITATFYDSNVVKIDTVTGKAYKITDVVTNGVLTRTLTEV